MEFKQIMRHTDGRSCDIYGAFVMLFFFLIHFSCIRMGVAATFMAPGGGAKPTVIS